MVQNVRTVTDIPPIAFQDFPVDIQIHIRDDGKSFSAEIWALGEMREVSLEMTSSDLLALNQKLQKDMQVFADRGSEIGTSMSTKLQDRIRPLATTGYYAFKSVFGKGDALAVIQSAMRAVHDTVDNTRTISVQITTKNFFLPWELMYPVNLDEPLDPEHFWGMNYIISRNITIPHLSTKAFVPTTIDVVHRPALGLLTNRELPAVKESEIPFFESLEKAGKITLAHLPALDPENQWEGLSEFKNFCNEPHDLIHFACHAFYEEELPIESYILLSDRFYITLMDMEVHELAVSNHPLVVMNACETGNLNPLYTSYFAGTFLKHGALGVVATECKVPDAFAADFTKQLYSSLLRGESLGESLLAARKHFLTTSDNPSGLLYSMYARPSIRIIQKGD
jgi:hypothetical protein